jgi:PAS domain S-box-containing protein
MAKEIENENKILREKILLLEKKLADLSNAEEQLLRQDAVYSDIFETIREGIAYTNLNGRVLSVNKALERILEIPREELIGRNIISLTTDLLSVKEVPRILPLIKGLISGKEIDPFVVEYKGRLLEVYADINIKTGRLTGTVRDVTGSLKTSEALEKSESRLRKAELISRTGNWELHMDSGKMYGSEGALSIYGVKDSPVDYQLTKEIPLPEYRPLLDKALKALIEKGEPYNMEFRIRKADTGEIVDVQSVAEYDSENRIIFGTIQDISRRKRAEEEIIRKNKDLSMLLRLAMDLLDTVDKKEVFSVIIKGAEDLIGMHSGAIYAISDDNIYLEVTDPPLPENFPDEFRRANLENHPHIRSAVRGKTTVILPDTQSEPLSVEERLIVDSRDFRSILYIPLIIQKHVAGVLIVGTIGQTHSFSDNDIGLCKTLSGIASLTLENSLLFEKLVAAKEKAEESDRLKTAFLHNISHEIRTPLNAIVGFSGFLDQPDLTDQERREYIDIIFQSNNQLLSIINDIINISQIETGQVILKRSETDLSRILKTLANQFRAEAERKNLDFRFIQKMPDADCALLTDETKLVQILTNLLGNAVKFTSSGFIELCCKRNENFIEITVEDSGIGIPYEEQQKVFERFYQVDKSITRTFSGTGLGLSISSAYAGLLGGRIGLSSEPGRGSKFSLLLPYVSAIIQNGHATEVVSEAKKLENDSIKILVAEDEESNYYLILAMLRSCGFNIVRAVNGREAVEMISRSSDFSMILMDIKMPEMDGFRATMEIRKLNASIPIIAQTAYAHPTDKARALESGCNDYISKPYSKTQLLGLIEKYLL